jgi:hypothetical protein
MVVAEAAGLQLLPDMSEAVLAAVSVSILVALVVVIVGAIVWFKRAVERQRELEGRVERLEEHVGRDPHP